MKNNKRPNKLVLVIEDDHASLQYLLLLLKKLDYSAIVGKTGEEGLALMEDKVVDVMLLDIALGPGISGLELGAILKKNKRHADTPMIAVSAFLKEKCQDLKSSGFVDYLSKPYTITDLQTILGKHL
jgi:two-component system sensor histidine kinase BarA